MPAPPAIILGTRPEIIKMAPIAHELSHRNLPFRLIHTGQHYSRNMSEVFLRELAMPPLDRFLDIGKGTPSQQLARCIFGLEKTFLKDPPSAILVEGDTNAPGARVVHISNIPPSSPNPAQSHLVFRTPEEPPMKLTYDLQPPRSLSHDLITLHTHHPIAKIFPPGANGVAARETISPTPRAQARTSCRATDRPGMVGTTRIL